MSPLLALVPVIPSCFFLLSPHSLVLGLRLFPRPRSTVVALRTRYGGICNLQSHRRRPRQRRKQILHEKENPQRFEKHRIRGWGGPKNYNEEKVWTTVRHWNRPLRSLPIVRTRMHSAPRNPYAYNCFLGKLSQLWRDYWASTSY